ELSRRPLAGHTRRTASGRSPMRVDRSAASALFAALKNDRVPPRARAPAPARKPAVLPLSRGQVSLGVYNGFQVGALSTEIGTQLAALSFLVASSRVDSTSQNMTQTVIQ